MLCFRYETRKDSRPKTKNTSQNKLFFYITLFMITLFLCACGKSDNETTNKVPETSSKTSLAAPQPSETAARDKYDIQLALDTDAKEISGSVKLLLTNTSDDDWSQLCFRDYIFSVGKTFDEMSGTDSNLESAFSGIYDASSMEALEYSRMAEDESVLLVNLQTPLASGESMEIQFDYKARILENTSRYRYSALNHEKNLLFELANFYPVLAIYENGEWQRTYTAFCSFFYYLNFSTSPRNSSDIRLLSTTSLLIVLRLFTRLPVLDATVTTPCALSSTAVAIPEIPSCISVIVF